jgi:replication fork clamp-binding protein CrfC
MFNLINFKKMTRVNFKNRKDAFLSATKVVAMALVIGLVAVSCGKKEDGNDKKEDEAKFTAGAKAKIETFGKSSKNVKLVYYVATSDCRKYHVMQYENGTNTEREEYWVYFSDCGETYKSAVKTFEDANMLLNKDDNNLWVQVKSDDVSKLSWQDYYDMAKSMFKVVE